MSNEAHCPTIGVGDVKIIMFDGVRSLSCVLHVPNVKEIRGDVGN